MSHPVTRRSSLRNRGLGTSENNGVTTARKSSRLKIKPTEVIAFPNHQLNDFNQQLNNSDQFETGNAFEQNEMRVPESLTSNPEVKDFECGICHKTFLSIKLLSSHSEDHCNSEVFQCNKCNAGFLSPAVLSAHLETHSDVVRLFRCGICNTGFFENASLLDHIKEQHKTAQASLYKCRVCLKTFEELCLLISHVKEVHPSATVDFICKFCGKHFTQETKLSLHLRAHSQESSKLSKCSICFSTVPSSMMRKHIVTHENEDEVSTTSRRSVTGSRNDGIKANDNVDNRKKVQPSSTRNKTTQRKEVKSADDNTAVENVRVKVDDDEDVEYGKGKVDDGGDDTEDAAKLKRVRKRRKVSSANRKSCFRENGVVKEVEDVKMTQWRKGIPSNRQQSSDDKKRPTPVIRDEGKLISTYMKVDVTTNGEVYDCDVCGHRLHECSSFIQHRSDHFFDNKFCIHCVHCSQIFDSFEDLFKHVGMNECEGYKCENCGKSFALEPHLLTHQMKEHSSLMGPSGEMICSVCQKVFDNKTAFLRHASSHSEDKCMECKLCRHAFTTQETLFGHLRITHSLIPLTRQMYKFNCDTCGTNFMKAEALTKHMEVVHSIPQDATPGPASRLNNSKPKLTGLTAAKRSGHWRSDEDDRKRRTCPICNKVFRRFKDVRRHIGTHTKPYLCSHCGKSFPYRYALDAHIKAFHSAENPWKCKTCGKFFSSQRSLIVHERIHSGVKPHQCPICQKSFRQVANLSMHIKLHNAEKTIKCDYCDYRCCHQGYLKRHMSTHSAEKKHFCDICSKGFTEKPNLNHHMKRHSKIKNHVCTVCGHRFAERYYLNNHMRIHTKEKPYVCPVCKRAFTMRPNMVSHIKKTHPSFKYQPIRPSHQIKPDNPVVTVNHPHHAHDVLSHDMLVPLQDYSGAVTVGDSCVPISSDNTVSTISSTHSVQSTSQAHALQLAAHLPQQPLAHLPQQPPAHLPQQPPAHLPQQPPAHLQQPPAHLQQIPAHLPQPPAHLPQPTAHLSQLPDHLPQLPAHLPQLPISVSTSPALHSHSLVEPKMDAVQFSTLRDILVHPHPSQTQPQPLPLPSLTTEQNIQPDAVVTRLSVESNRHQDVEGQQHCLTLNRFDVPPFDPGRVQGQSFPPTPISNQDYMYTYPSMHHLDSFLPVQQNYFPLTNHQHSHHSSNDNSHPHNSQAEQKP